MKLLDHRIADAAMAEITQANISPLIGLKKVVLEITQCKIIDSKHVVASRLPTLLFGSHLTLLNLDIVFSGKITQSLTVAQMLQLHKEIDGTTPFPTAEALAKPTRLWHRKWRRTVIMKRTEPPIIGTFPLQWHEIAHHLNYVGGFQYALDCCVADFSHNRSKITQFSLPLQTETKTAGSRPYVSPTYIK